ncbi:MAG: hypothetical protein FWC26_06020 [Fibromonadales bacterium]|nr:hypothetical protein [Fibromonadales bacterium]
MFDILKYVILIIFLSFFLSCSKNNSNASPDIDFAMQVIKKTNEILYFEDYEKCLDSLFANKYKSIHNWCRTVGKDDFDLEKHYLEQNANEMFFLKYYNKHCLELTKKNEFSVIDIDFTHRKRLNSHSKAMQKTHISIAKTATNILAEYSLTGIVDKPEQLEVELSEDEWHDFVKVLHECNFTGWKKFEITSDFKDTLKRWELSIRYLDNDTLEYSYKEYPPNWDEFKKIMDDMETKIKLKTSTK